METFTDHIIRVEFRQVCIRKAPFGFVAFRLDSLICAKIGKSGRRVVTILCKVHFLQAFLSLHWQTVIVTDRGVLR